MHFLSLTTEQQLEAIQFMSRTDLAEIMKLSLPGSVMKAACERLYADLKCGEETYRWHNAAEGETVLKRRTYGKDDTGYGGWSVHKKFSADELPQAKDAWNQLCFKAENPEFVEITEGEMVPAESSTMVETSTTIEVSDAVGSSIKQAVGWMDASKQYAQISIVCAARAGAEFSRIKDQCERGEWMKVLKMLPFGKDTIYKYIKVADEMQARLAETNDSIDLLTLPDPAQLMSRDHTELVEQINAVTGEQSLRQLYFEWGIVKQPTPTGGARKVDDKTPQELLSVRREAATQAAQNLCLSIQKICLNETRCIELVEPAILKQLAGDLMDAYSIVRQLEQVG
jgi:hypothetical protein